MVGRDVAIPQARPSPLASEPCLKVAGLSVEGLLSDVSFEVRRGEILGIGGLVGAGRTELLQTLFGVYRMDAGSISMNGRAMKIRSPKDAIDAGIAYVPEDRKLHGLALNLSISENFALPNLRALSRFGLLRKGGRNELAKQYAERLNLRCRHLNELALLLRGGNQQKIILGKWLARQPLVLLLDEPTRGIDVGAKSEIYALIRRLASEGMAIVLVTSELPELLALSDRLLVIREGRMNGELLRDAMSEEAVMQLATPGFKRATE